MELRKRLAAFAAIGAVVSGMGALPAAADYDPCDVNRDGTVSIQDSIYVNRYLMGHFYVSDPSVLDTTGNCIVDTADSARILAALTDVDFENPFVPLDAGTSTASVASTTATKSREYVVYDFATNQEVSSAAYTLTLSEGEGVSAYSIIPPTDDMVDYSNSGVVYLLTTYTDANGEIKYGVGTGFVVGDHTIATAAHCIYDWQTSSYVSDMTIRLFDDDGNFVKTLTNNNNTIQAHIPSYWKNPPVSGTYHMYDYALITVTEDLSSYEHFKLGCVLDSAVNNSNLPVSVCGFPGTTNLEVATGNFTEMYDLYFKYTTDTLGGQSGGPVFVTSEYTMGTNEAVELKTVVGINTYSATSYNQGNRMTPEMLQFYLTNSYNTYEE